MKISESKINYFKIFFAILISLNVSKAFSQKVEGVGPIVITVADMDKSVDFYSKVLSFEKISDTEIYGSDYEKLENIFGLRMRIVKMKLGEEQIQLNDYLTSGGKPIPIDAVSNDLSFQHIAIVVSDMDKAYTMLRKFNVEHVSTGPQTIPATNKAAAGVKAFYFHDPDNHNLELIYFPSGKGNPKWQQSNDKTFLGIDHTAIGISSTEKSLKFYRDILGLELKGESYNFGTEQEHLNNVEGASLHISGLRAASGPGVEFLEYLKPGVGKKYPADAKADDLISWQTTVSVDDLDALAKKLHDSRYAFVSKETVNLKNDKDEIFSAIIVRDPDGHQILIQQLQKNLTTK
ncbi:MAG: VOC family protein [Bacteroidia bacterium]